MMMMLIEMCGFYSFHFFKYLFQIFVKMIHVQLNVSVKRMWKFVTRDHPSSIPLLEFILLLQYELERMKRGTKEKEEEDPDEGENETEREREMEVDQGEGILK